MRSTGGESLPGSSGCPGQNAAGGASAFRVAEGMVNDHLLVFAEQMVEKSRPILPPFGYCI